LGEFETWITNQSTDTDSSDEERAEGTDDEDDVIWNEEIADKDEEETGDSNADPPERDFLAIYATLLDLSGRLPVFAADELPELTEKMIEGLHLDDPSPSRASEPLDDLVIARRLRRRERFFERYRRCLIFATRVSRESEAQVYRRDRIRSHLRRLAFSQSSGEEAEADSPNLRRNRMIRRIQRLLSEEPTTPEDNDMENGDRLPPTRSTQSISEIGKRFGAVFCVICLEKQRDTLLVPCGHLGSCWECCNDIRQCPVCRCAISNKVRVSSASDDVDCAKCGGVKDGVNSSCGHLSFCHECDDNVANCLVCKQKIMQRVKMLWS